MKMRTVTSLGSGYAGGEFTFKPIQVRAGKSEPLYQCVCGMMKFDVAILVGFGAHLEQNCFHRKSRYDLLIRARIVHVLTLELD